MSRYYGNNPQPDPRYFDFGNAFLGGIQNAQNNQRQNALLDMEKQQFGMQQDQYRRQIAGQEQAAQAQQQAIQRRAQILSQVLPDEFKPMAEELAYELDEADVAKLLQQNMAPNGGEPYTLGPGAARYDASGKLIAERPFAPANHTFIDLPGGQAAINPRTLDTTMLSGREDQRAAEAADTAAVEAAKAGVSAQADKSKTAAQNATALSAYEVGMSELAKVFSETDTGPIVGRISAVTSKQQKAEGAVAAMAPLLKQLFRSAGEGIFTDRDQLLLLDMAPKRTDNPDVAQWKITNINAIVRAKLGGGQPVQPSGGKRVKVDAEGNVIGN